MILGSQYGPHSGSQDFAHASPATFGQTVTGLSDGVAYDLSFFARRDSSSATLSVSVDDGTPVNIILASGYTLQTVRFVPGGSGESTFKLTGNGDKSAYLDSRLSCGTAPYPLASLLLCFRQHILR